MGVINLHKSILKRIKMPPKIPILYLLSSPSVPFLWCRQRHTPGRSILGTRASIFGAADVNADVGAGGLVDNVPGLVKDLLSLGVGGEAGLEARVSVGIAGTNASVEAGDIIDNNIGSIG